MKPSNHRKERLSQTVYLVFPVLLALVSCNSASKSNGNPGSGGIGGSGTRPGTGGSGGAGGGGTGDMTGGKSGTGGSIVASGGRGGADAAFDGAGGGADAAFGGAGGGLDSGTSEKPDVTLGSGGAGAGGNGSGGNGSGGNGMGGKTGAGGQEGNGGTKGSGGQTGPDGGEQYATGYLAWQAPAGPGDPGTGTGPALIVTGTDHRLEVWNSVTGFSFDTRPYNPNSSITLTGGQIADLFSRLAAVNAAALPHAPLTAAVCYPSVYFRLCATCEATTLSYAAPESITPEMNSVWAWFDGISGLTALTNPRNYCRFMPSE